MAAELENNICCVILNIYQELGVVWCMLPKCKASCNLRNTIQNTFCYLR
jgi:hypothetical protein